MKVNRLAAILVLLFCTSQVGAGARVEAGAQVGAGAHVQPIIDIVIDAGHGGVDGGTSYQDIYEKDINLQVGKLLYQSLKEKGYRVVLNRTEDYALSDENRWLRNPSRHLRDLAQRKHLAIALVPQMMISLHVNWSSSSAQRGPIVLYQQNDQSYFLASLLQHSLNHLYKTNGRPIKGKTYYVLKHTVCPTVIVEMGFISNTNDRYRLTNADKQKEIAEAIARAAEEYLLLVGEINERKQGRWDVKKQKEEQRPWG